MTRFPPDPEQAKDVTKEFKPCPWRSCQCTHVGCTSGWIDLEDEKGTRAIPCPVCRPEVATHLRKRDATMRSKRADLPNLPRPSRHGQKDGPW